MADAKEKDKDSKSIDNVKEHKNALTFDEKVIKKIVGFAVSEIPGILAMSGNLLTGITDMLKNSDDPTKGISIELGKKQVAIDMKLVCEYGQNIPEIFQNIIDKVSSVIKEMTGLDVVEVNVHVADVLVKEEFDSKKKSVEVRSFESAVDAPEKPVSDSRVE